MDIMSRLPAEISTEVLSYLDLKDILNCNLVNHVWYDLTNSNFVWKRFCDVIPDKENIGLIDFRWLIRFPCRWKLNYLSYKKVIRNWKDGNYRRHKVAGNFTAMAYDGKTLVLYNRQIEVYRIKNGRMVHHQKLKDKRHALMCVTNTSFIVVNCGHSVFIYKLINDRYVIANMLHIDGKKKKLAYSVDTTFMKDVLKSVKPVSFFLHTLSTTYLSIIGNTLFLCLRDMKLICAWNMKKLKCIMEKVVDVNDFVHDSQRVYVGMKDIITVYDENAQVCYMVKLQWNFHNLRVNNHLLLAVGHGISGVDICSWDKFTGKLLHDKRMRVSSNCLLHPNKDILIDVANPFRSVGMEMFACRISDHEILWKRSIPRGRSLGELHSIVAGNFLIFIDYTNFYLDLSMSKRIVDIFDVGDGNYLHTVAGMDADLVFVSHDILIYAERGEYNYVQVYS